MIFCLICSSIFQSLNATEAKDFTDEDRKGFIRLVDSYFSDDEIFSAPFIEDHGEKFSLFLNKLFHGNEDCLKAFVLLEKNLPQAFQIFQQNILKDDYFCTEGYGFCAFGDAMLLFWGQFNDRVKSFFGQKSEVFKSNARYLRGIKAQKEKRRQEILGFLNFLSDQAEYVSFFCWRPRL